MTDPDEMIDRLGHLVALVIDGGYCGIEPSTVVDMTTDPPQVLRVGKGPTDMFRE
jgi:tRNA A37 threonylcarbamoyladenosine synthetase subunit TsaC/SUA5/YrdC